MPLSVRARAFKSRVTAHGGLSNFEQIQTQFCGPLVLGIRVSFKVALNLHTTMHTRPLAILWPPKSYTGRTHFSAFFPNPQHRRLRHTLMCKAFQVVPDRR